jgi:hypothetical protein
MSSLYISRNLPNILWAFAIMVEAGEGGASLRARLVACSPFWAPWAQALGGLGRTMRCKNQIGRFVWLPTIHCFAYERKRCLQCLVARSEPFHATLMLFGCNTGQRSGNLFLEEVNIPST